MPYDESRYLMALQKRGAPLLKHAAQSSRFTLRPSSGRELGGLRFGEHGASRTCRGSAALGRGRVRGRGRLRGKFDRVDNRDSLAVTKRQLSEPRQYAIHSRAITKRGRLNTLINDVSSCIDIKTDLNTTGRITIPTERRLVAETKVRES